MPNCYLRNYELLDHWNPKKGRVSIQPVCKIPKNPGKKSKLEPYRKVQGKIDYKNKSQGFMTTVQTAKITLIRLSLKVLALLPLPLVQAIGTFLGQCAWYMNSRSAKVTRRNLQLCFPEMTEVERIRLAKESLIETSKTIVEMGKAWLVEPEVTLDYIKKVTEKGNIEETLRDGKGLITIVPHLGNWEVLNIYAANRFPLNVLYQPPKLVELDGFVRDARARSGTKVYPTDRRGVAAMLQALIKGEVVGILPDQEPPENAGIFSPFFGIEASTMTLLSKLAQKTGAQVVSAYAKRLPKGKGFEVIIVPADPDIYSNDINLSVAALNRSIEECIKDAPAQYQWEYKRFKIGPKGKTGYYHFLPHRG